MTSKPHISPDAATVLAKLTQGYHEAGHHPNCSTRIDEGCNCYARDTAEARAALRRLEEQYEDLVIRADERSKVIEERNENLRACGERSRTLAEKVIGLEEQLKALRDVLAEADDQLALENEKHPNHNITIVRQRISSVVSSGAAGAVTPSDVAGRAQRVLPRVSAPVSSPAKEPKA